MFNIETMKQESNGFFSLSAICTDTSLAEKLRSGYIGPVRQISIFADLYHIGNQLILEAPDRETLLKIADVLNHSIEQF